MLCVHAQVSKASDAPSVLDGLKSQAAGTTQLIKLLQAYKDLGDSKAEVGLSHQYMCGQAVRRLIDS